jgi:hypothetical protein
VSLRVLYPGWGTWCVAGEGIPRVVVDPCVSHLLDEPCAQEHQVHADLVLLTHGHHEHIRDIHRLAYGANVPIVAPPQVIKYLVEFRRMAPEQFVEIVPGREVVCKGVRVRAHGFPHLEKHDVAGKLAILRRDNPLGALAMLLRFGPRILSSWRAIRHQPEEGPYLAYDLSFQIGLRVLFTCEAFTELVAAQTVLSWLHQVDEPIDLAIVGVESGYEESAAQLLNVLAPGRALAAAIHKSFERFYGKPPVVGDRLLARTQVPTTWMRAGTEASVSF